MTAPAMFEEELRHHCRNPRCRLKLQGPVENSPVSVLLPRLLPAILLETLPLLREAVGAEHPQ